MATSIIRPKDRAEWLEYRKTGIGSSEISSIVGLNPFETPYQLWRRKRGLDGPKEETFAMKAGHYLEDAVAQFWADETKKEIIKRSAGDWLIRDTEKPFLQVSPDRTYWVDPSHHLEKGILECKTTQKAVDGDDIPRHWFCQVQYLLGVAGFNKGSLAWLTQGREFGYRDITLVPDFFGWLVDEADKFYSDCVIGGREPNPINVRDIMIKYDKHTEGACIEADEALYQTYKELKAVREQIDALTVNKEALEDALKMAFRDAEKMTYGQETLATWKAAKDSVKFDAKAFQKEHSDLCTPYMQTVPGSRRFILK